MRIVHVVAAGEIGGAERMLVDLARAPSEASVALLTPNDELRRLFVEAEISIDDRGHVREHPLAFLRPGDVGWLAKVLRRRNATIVHLHTFASQLLGTRAALEVGARIVRTEHSTRVYDDPSCRPFARWTLARADRVVFISEHVRRVALERLPMVATRTNVVIPNGIDPERFAWVPPAPPSSNLKLVALGRLDPRKGLDLALDAVARVPNVTLEIVGDGSERARLEKLAAPLGDRVRFSGFAADVRGALARADAVLSSAKEEGLGVALLEAMAMGRPVIAVPVGGIPEILATEPGEPPVGWLASTRAAAALAEIIDKASRSTTELERRGAAARARVLEKFTVNAMRAKYAKLYEELTS